MEDAMKKLSERFQVEEPEIFDAAHITDHDSYEERLQEAEQDYNDACEDFLKENPGSEAIMKAAEYVEAAAKILFSRVLVIFKMPNATDEAIEYANALMDRLTKDSCARERTCSQLYRKTREKYPEQKDRIHRLLIEKQKRMKFLDRCMATQAKYIKLQQTGKTGTDPVMKMLTESSRRAARIRSFIPEGGRFCPPRVFPPERIPEGQRVPMPPRPYLRFKGMDPKDLVFNVEHHNFEIPPNYVSEDGTMDSESIVWDYENSTVTMKFRGGEPVTWPFKQYIDLRDVPKPGDWVAEYIIRLNQQQMQKLQGGILT